MPRSRSSLLLASVGLIGLTTYAYLSARETPPPGGPAPAKPPAVDAKPLGEAVKKGLVFLVAHLALQLGQQ